MRNEFIDHQAQDYYQANSRGMCDCSICYKFRFLVRADHVEALAMNVELAQLTDYLCSSFGVDRIPSDEDVALRSLGVSQ